MVVAPATVNTTPVDALRALVGQCLPDGFLVLLPLAEVVSGWPNVGTFHF